MSQIASTCSEASRRRQRSGAFTEVVFEMSSYVVFPDDMDDSLDLELAQLSMDFDAGMANDPLLQAKLPSISEVPAPPTDGLEFDARQGAGPLFTQQTPYPEQVQKKTGCRLNRTREKNRLAQARYRERQKVCFNWQDRRSSCGVV